MASWRPAELEPRSYGAAVHAAVILAGFVQLWRQWRRPGGRWVL